MRTPVFEEFDPASGCDCPGCVHWRRALLPACRTGRSGPVTSRTTIVLAAAVAAVLGAGQAGPAVATTHAPPRPGAPRGDQPPDTPQGYTAPLNGPAGAPAAAVAPATTRAQIINRAKQWVAAGVPYSMDDYWSDGYRQDCSGFVSMAWNLGTNEWTGSLDKFGVRITKEQLQPGDILLFHNVDDPERGSHVVIFGGWTDYTHTQYTAYEETPPKARKQATPYAYWSNSDRYVPYRYKNVTESKAGLGDKDLPLTDDDPATVDGYAGALSGAGAVAGPGATAWSMAQKKGEDMPMAGLSMTADELRAASRTLVPGFPGLGMFRPGAHNPYVTRLGRRLIKKGFGRHYTGGPGPHWGEPDRRNVEAFQRAQGWHGAEADGYPGPDTWRRLFS
ncbi:peptidoglycan-binding protein [Streptomyces sp. NPDC005708]|uniref:peptidoglycan-binding protein n=1 Tax=Streptomyces sp. NPDC005708 TaxID=3154564 RepID=UPI0033F08516